MATERQKRVIKEIVENRGSARQAMKRAGYSDAYSKNPAQLRATETFQDLINELLPRIEVMTSHKELLHKVNEYVIDGQIVRSDQLHSDVKGAIDMAYKLRGDYAAEQFVIDSKYDSMTDEEIEKRTKLLEKKVHGAIDGADKKGAEGTKTGTAKKA